MRLADCWRGSELPYALAHASKTLFWTASDIYFAFYLTQVCGLSPWTMGFVLAASYLVILFLRCPPLETVFVLVFVLGFVLGFVPGVGL